MVGLTSVAVYSDEAGGRGRCFDFDALDDVVGTKVRTAAVLSVDRLVILLSFVLQVRRELTAVTTGVQSGFALHDSLHVCL